MQGKKIYQEKLFMNFQLSQHVPENNFYRRLKNILNLGFLYKITEDYYGKEGQKSVDPLVFFKICLVGYLENIISDRKLIEFCSMRMDVLFFLDYDIDEKLPWHSTLSRTRQLFPECVFEQVFNKILKMCVEQGMVSGKIQTVDSAPVKANASMDSLELKVPAEELDNYLRKVRVMSRRDRKAKQNKAPAEQRTIRASERELKEIKSRNKKWQKDQDQRPGAGNKGSKYTSNKTHYSPTDPDARISVKPGKARKLNYLSQMSVDTLHHVITHIHADFADKKDNQCLQYLTEKLRWRFKTLELDWKYLIADTGYSSGENYAYLEQRGIISYIPPHGTYKGGPEGFQYIQDGDFWLCPENKHVKFHRILIEKKNNIKKRRYFTRRADCRDCPIKKKCIGKSHEKRIDITYYRDEYERAIKRIKSDKGKYMKKKRQSTVEPVFGSLINYYGMRKVNVKGIKQADKVMLMAATAYNIKKLLKYSKIQCGKAKKSAVSICFFVFCRIRMILSRFNRVFILRQSFNY